MPRLISTTRAWAGSGGLRLFLRGGLGVACCTATLLLGAFGCRNADNDEEATFDAPSVAPRHGVSAATPSSSSSTATSIASDATDATDAAAGSVSASKSLASPASVSAPGSASATSSTGAATDATKTPRPPAPVPAVPAVTSATSPVPTRQALRDSLAKRFSPLELQAIANEEAETEAEAVASADAQMLSAPPSPWPRQYAEKLLNLEDAGQASAARQVADVYHLTDAELQEIVLESMERTVR